MNRKHKHHDALPHPDVRREATGWSDLLLICRKCSRKLEGGFGATGADSLRRSMRRALRQAGRRGEIGVIEVPCFGLCPKNAVTLAMASRPGELQIVPAGYDPARLTS